MKIGIITRDADSKRSGLGNYILNLCEQISKIKNEDLDIYFIHHKISNRTIYKLKNINEVIISRYPFLCEAQINKLGLDILHQNVIPWKSPFPNLINCKNVVTVHGDIHYVLPEYSPNNRLGRFYLKMLEKYTSKKISHFITVSNSLKKSLIHNLKIPEHKITTIYHGVNHEIFRLYSEEQTDHIKNEYNLGKYILFVNNFMLKKNLDTLFYAFEKLVSNKELNHRLVIVGGGWEISHIYSKIKRSRIKNHVLFTGHIERNDLPLLYCGADIFVYPSLHETFGMPLTEAMACGCPIITSNRFSMPEIIGNCGILLEDPLDVDELYNKMNNLINNDKLKNELRILSIERAKMFSWQTNAERTIELYQKIK